MHQTHNHFHNTVFFNFLDLPLLKLDLPLLIGYRKKRRNLSKKRYQILSFHTFENVFKF